MVQGTPELKLLLVRDVGTIRDLLKVIDNNAQGLAFVVDDSDRLMGVATDGDVRRHLLGGGDIDDPVTVAMNPDYTARPSGSRAEDLITLLQHEVSHIPLLDTKGRVVDYASRSKLRILPVLEPVLLGNEMTYVIECLRTNWISSQGAFVGRFERQMEEFTESENALAVSSGTAALHIALASLGIGPGDEVVVPDLTFGASVNAVLHAGATPVLVDIEEDTWTIDVNAIEDVLTPATKAIMPVHLYGQACRMDEINTLARKHDLLVIEDCAEAIGTTYKGKAVGALSDAAAFSFFGNKTVTTGEGGMVLFANPEAADLGRTLRDHGMRPDRRYWHDLVGYNYRMTNLQAAVGVAQMERVEELIEAKRKIAEFYRARLKALPGLILPDDKGWSTNSYWLFSIRLTPDFPVSRDKAVERLRLNGIEARPLFYPMHEMPPFAEFGKDREFKHSKAISETGFSLPSSCGLTEDELQRVCSALEQIVTTRELMVNM